MYKKRIGIASVFILFLGLISGLILVRETQDIREEAVVGGVDIFFTPSSLEVEPNSTSNYYDIYLDSKAYEVSAVAIEITFDNQSVLVTDMLESTSLPLLLQKEIGTNSALITLGISNPQAPFNGTDKIATVVFDALAVPGLTSINFSDNTQVAAISEPGDVLGTATSGEVIIASFGLTPGIPTPTNTPVPTSTPLPTPTPTEDPVGTPVPLTPTPSPETTQPIGTPVPLTPTPTGGAACTPTSGDSNGDGEATGNDFTTWLRNFDPVNVVSGGPSSGDFNCDDHTNGNDFTIWLRNFTPN